MQNRKAEDLDWNGAGEKQGGVEGKETVIMIYSLRKKSIFNKRKNVIQLNIYTKIFAYIFVYILKSLVYIHTNMHIYIYIQRF